MESPAKRLDWIVEFIQMDLPNLRRGDLLNLKDEFEEFFSPDSLIRIIGIRPVPLAQLMPNQFEESDFKALQKDLKSILKDPGKQKKLSSLSFSMIPKGQIIDRPTLVHAIGSTRDIFLLLFYFLLAIENPDFEHCPECGRLFLVRRRKKYCGRRCANLASVKRWNKKQQKTNPDFSKDH